ncbi:MAG: hypothetical protein A2Y82_01410 [Candidatus Buchananbacteria bacterium RBG_13_36_9]|uniref:Uncharacterized protein n=1 Tax=Candidatus Buchananbacteria bacterium RBG_13_36_9 TaxID=1797530 RepID=A0A1G1XPV9_9BACT|nr:MAG: hypothetical protein A2Y82_01410 [Candidatus Buchananbacteria bacterium RBG_13_36_9]
MPKFKKGERAFFIGDSVKFEIPPKQMIQQVYLDKKGHHLCLVNDDWVPESVLSGWEEMEIRKLNSRIKLFSKSNLQENQELAELKHKLKQWKKIRSRRQKRK